MPLMITPVEPITRLHTSDSFAALPIFSIFLFRQPDDTVPMDVSADILLKNHRSLWKNPFPYAIIPKLGPIRAEGGVNAVCI